MFCRQLNQRSRFSGTRRRSQRPGRAPRLLIWRRAGAAAAGSLLLLGSPARAQVTAEGRAQSGVHIGRATQLGQRGDFTIGAERLFGLSITNNGGEAGGDFNQTAFSIAAQRNNSPLSIPRVAFDYYIINNLSLGGTFAFYEDFDDASPDGFLVAPRAGYAIPLNRSWTLLPRAGFTFYTEEVDDNGAFSVFALSLEAAVAVTVARNFGFLGAITLDVSLTGTGPAPGPDNGFSQVVVGIPLFGMYVLF